MVVFCLLRILLVLLVLLVLPVLASDWSVRYFSIALAIPSIPIPLPTTNREGYY